MVKKFLKKHLPRPLVALLIDLAHWVYRPTRQLKLRFFPYLFLPNDLKFWRDGGLDLLTDSIPKDETYRLFVFGGYLGDSTALWNSALNLTEAHVFEPVPSYCSVLRERFTDQRVEIHQFGVGKQGGRRQMLRQNDATSQANVGRADKLGFVTGSETVDFRGPEELLALLKKVSTRSILEVNIEGGEYELIDALAEEGLLHKFDYIFVQFHDVGPSTLEKVIRSRQQLSENHVCVWRYDMVWECWKIPPHYSARQN